MMFLHLGNGISVKTSDIIAIQDFALFKSGPGNDFFTNNKSEPN